MHKVILDTDPGIDDTMAIAYALCHPDIELLGLTTVFGNVNIEKATRNAQYVLHMLGATTVKVAKGAAVPIVQNPMPHAEFVHGEDGIGNCYDGSVSYEPTAEHSALQALDAADYIIEQAHLYPGEISLIAVGPLTNIAIALEREPKLPELVQQLIIMGGAVTEPGNVSPVAEANFLGDPHAADQVLGASWPATIVGLDVTHQILITDTHLKQLDDNAAKTGELIWQTSRFYVDFYSSKGAAAGEQEPACAMHDAAAVAYLLIPDAFGVISGPARVIHDGVAVGQLALDRKGYEYGLDHWRDRPNCHACMQVDDTHVLKHFVDTIVNYRLC